MAENLGKTEITKPILLDATGQKILKTLEAQNSILSAIGSGTKYKPNNINDVFNIVRAGRAKEVFNIGDQIVLEWTNVNDGKTYDCPLDVIGFQEATLQSGDKVPAMEVQWHYCTPFGLQFSNAQAFYYAEEELKAGTYNITIGSDWGDNCKKNVTYQFTLSKPVPKEGQLAGFTRAPDVAESNWQVSSYKSNADSQAIETVSVKRGNGGTSLGTLKFGGDGKLNCLQRTAYGNNRWRDSALRQWLNSSAEKGKWWNPQSKWDRPPKEADTVAGFMTGCDKEMLRLMEHRKVQVKTGLNRLTDKSEGQEFDITYDWFFPIALEEMNIAPDIKGEGEISQYYKILSGSSEPLPQYKTYPQYRCYNIANHASAQYIWLRSANLSHSCYVKCVYPSGLVHSNSAYWGHCVPPVCLFC